MARNKHESYTVDSQGNLVFTNGSRLISKRYKPDTIWVTTGFLVSIMLLCAVANIVGFLQLFSSFMYDNIYLRVIAVFALSIGFELSAIYLGYNLKLRNQDYNVSKFLAYGFTAAFVISALIYGGLRIVTADLAFPNYSDMTTSLIGNGSSQTAVSSSNAMYYALGFALMPIITSAVCFLASYTMSNPLREELKKLDKEHNDITDLIGQLEATLAEYDADAEYLSRILKDDDGKHKTAYAMIQRKAKTYCDYVRECFNERLGEPCEIDRPVPYLREDNNIIRLAKDA